MERIFLELVVANCFVPVEIFTKIVIGLIESPKLKNRLRAGKQNRQNQYKLKLKNATFREILNNIEVVTCKVAIGHFSIPQVIKNPQCN